MTTNYDLGFQDGLQEACAVALGLEERWRNTATRMRQRKRWFFGWFVPTEIERDALSIEAAADGIAAIRKIVSERKPKESSAMTTAQRVEK